MIRFTLGMPLVQAHAAERSAPPFGVYIHESARAFAPANAHPFTTVFWRWWLIDEGAQQVASTTAKTIDAYFDWCQKHSAELEYPLERIKAHQQLAKEYLLDVESTLETIRTAKNASAPKAVIGT